MKLILALIKTFEISSNSWKISNVLFLWNLKPVKHFILIGPPRFCTARLDIISPLFPPLVLSLIQFSLVFLWHTTYLSIILLYPLILFFYTSQKSVSVDTGRCYRLIQSLVKWLPHHLLKMRFSKNKFIRHRMSFSRVDLVELRSEVQCCKIADHDLSIDQLFVEILIFILIYDNLSQYGILSTLVLFLRHFRWHFAKMTFI